MDDRENQSAERYYSSARYFREALLPQQETKHSSWWLVAIGVVLVALALGWWAY